MSTWLLLCFQTIHKIVYLFNFSVFRIDIYFLMISMKEFVIRRWNLEISVKDIFNVIHNLII